MFITCLVFINITYDKLIEMKAEKQDFNSFIERVNFDDKPPGPEIRRAVTTWLTEDEIAIYERLQKLSRKRFGKELRKMVRAFIRAAEAKAS